MNKYVACIYCWCMLVLCGIASDASASRLRDSVDVRVGKAIGEAVNQQILHRAKGGNHIINLNFRVNDDDHVITKFRTPDDKQIWDMEKLSAVNEQLVSFQNNPDSAECYLAVIAIYNFVNIHDKSNQPYDYEYFQERALQAKSSQSVEKFIDADEVIRKGRTLTLMGEAVKAAPVLSKIGNRKIMVYCVITYYVPPIGVGVTKGKLFHHQGFLSTSNINGQIRQDIQEHLANFRGGLNKAIAPDNTDLPDREEQVKKSIENICLLYRKGIGDGTGYDNNALARKIDFKQDFIDATAPDKTKGKMEESVAATVRNYLDQINQQVAGVKIGLVYLDSKKPQNDEIKKNAEEAAKNDKKLLVEVELSEGGSVIDLHFFNGSGSGNNICEATTLKSDIEHFCKDYWMNNDQNSHNAFTDAVIALFTAYRSAFIYVKCATDEDYVRGHYPNSPVRLAAAGFTNVSMDMLDYFAIVTMFKDLACWAGKTSFVTLPKLLRDNTVWILNIRQQYENIESVAMVYSLTGSIPYDNIRSLLPPMIQTFLPTEAGFMQAGGALSALVDYLDENKANPYFYGQVAGIVVFSYAGVKELGTLIKNIRNGNLTLKISAAAEKYMAKLENFSRQGKDIIIRTAQGVKTLVRTESGEWRLLEEMKNLRPLETIWAKLGKLGEQLKALGIAKEEGDILKVFRSSAKNELIAEISAEKAIVEISEMAEGTALATSEELSVAFRNGGNILLEESAATISITESNGVYRICRNGVCFTGNTLVHTNSGPRSIEHLQKGDSVYAWNETAGQTTLNRIKGVIKKTTQKLLQLSFSTTMLLTTPEHPFYVDGLWKQAADLRTGDIVHTISGGTDTLRDILAKDTVAVVYNLDVEKSHTYYVGAGILVHNACALTEFSKSLGKDFDRLLTWGKSTGMSMDEWGVFFSKLHETGHGVDDIKKFVPYLESIRSTEYAAIVKGLSKEDLAICIKRLEDYPIALQNLKEVGATSDEVTLFLKYMDGDIHPGFRPKVEAMSENVMRDYLDELNDLLKSDGTFANATHEENFQKYLKRKKTDKEVPRSRDEWLIASEDMKNTSAVVRGNNFNKKAEIDEWYRYNEVTLSTGKRVDSYVLPANGKPGEIISRKASDLRQIGIKKFEKFLEEMKLKYPPGSDINAPKFGEELVGKKLEGIQILELPESNLLPNGLEGLKEFTTLADKYNIKLRFKPE